MDSKAWNIDLQQNERDLLYYTKKLYLVESELRQAKEELASVTPGLQEFESDDMALNGMLYQFVRDTCTLCVCDKERDRATRGRSCQKRHGVSQGMGVY